MTGKELEKNIDTYMQYDGKSKEVFVTFWLGGNRFTYPISELTTNNGHLFIHANTENECHYLAVD